MNGFVQRKNGTTTGHYLLKIKSSICWKTEFSPGHGFQRFVSIFDPWNDPPLRAYPEPNKFALIKRVRVAEPRLIGYKIPEYEEYVVNTLEKLGQLNKNHNYRKYIEEN